jgi:hypothetical protein
VIGGREDVPQQQRRRPDRAPAAGHTTEQPRDRSPEARKSSGEWFQAVTSHALTTASGSGPRSCKPGCSPLMSRSQLQRQFGVDGG